jgi:hypothetical protein
LRFVATPRRKTREFPPARPLPDGGVRLRIEAARHQPIGFAVAGPDEGWMMRGTCAVIDGTVVLVTLCIAPWVRPDRRGLDVLVAEMSPPPAVRVGSKELRAVRIPALERQVYAALQNAAEGERELARSARRLAKSAGLPLRPNFETFSPADDLLGIAPKYGAKRGRKPLDDGFLRWVAHEYMTIEESDLAARAGGAPRPPSGLIYDRIAQEAFRQGKAKAQVQGDTAKKWVWKARKRDFLPATKPGQKSSGPGPRLFVPGENEQN